MQIQKDFNNWNIKKTNLDTIEVRPFFHVGEVWYCYLGVNVGYEQDGKGDDFLRPVVILKKFGDTFWGIPLTRTIRPEKPYLYQFSFTEGIVSNAVLSQIRLIDARRLAYQTGEMKESEFDELRKKLKALLP